MKKVMPLFLGITLLAPAIAFAGWQVATPITGPSTDAFFRAGTQTDTTFSISRNSSDDAFSNQFASLGQPANLFAVSISGSIKENLERIMDRYHWKVVWKAPYDYNFDGRIAGPSLPSVVEQLLKPFPLQAVLYVSNRTMTIIPRKA